MATNPIQEHTHLVLSKARRMCRCIPEAEMSIEDAAQELWLYVLKAMKKHRPEMGPLGPLLNAALDNGVASIHRKRSAAKRSAPGHMLSLDEPVATGTDGAIPRHATITLNHDDQAHEVVREMVAGLPGSLRDLAQELADGTVSSAARNLGMSREKVRHGREALRARFQHMGAC